MFAPFAELKGFFRDHGAVDKVRKSMLSSFSYQVNPPGSQLLRVR